MTPAVVSGLMGGEVVLRFQYDRRTTPLRHGKSGGEPDDSPANHNRTIGL